MISYRKHVDIFTLSFIFTSLSLQGLALEYSFFKTRQNFTDSSLVIQNILFRQKLY
jgi:hypothetical protein